MLTQGVPAYDPKIIKKLRSDAKTAVSGNQPASAIKDKSSTTVMVNPCMISWVRGQRACTGYIKDWASKHMEEWDSSRR